MKLAHPQASTLGPINTDPKDLVIWSGSSATLQAMATGPIKYVPSIGTAPSGAIAIYTSYVPWPWGTLVNEADEFSADQIPAQIYYENVDRSTAEPAIRALIQSTYGNALPAPEDTMVNDFFAGNWIGKTDTAPNGDPLLRPLIVKAGTNLGTIRVSTLPPPDPTTPNSVILKMRKSDNTTAVDIAQIAIAAYQECRADTQWTNLFTTLGIEVFPLATGTVSGQRILFFSDTKINLATLRSLLENDQNNFKTNPTFYSSYLGATQTMLIHVSHAEAVLGTVQEEMANPCNPPDTTDFDLQTLGYYVELINAYRYLMHLHLFVYLNSSQWPGTEIALWWQMLSDQMTVLNQTLTALYTDPHFSDRSTIDNKVQYSSFLASQLAVTPQQLATLKTFQQITGAVMLIFSIVQAASGLANLAAAIVNGGENFGSLGFGGGAVTLANGTTYVLDEATINNLITSGILTSSAGTIVLMAAQGKGFNPSGQTPAQAQNWVNSRHPNWTHVDFPGGEKWLDENGVERIRYMRPNPKKVLSSPWEHVKTGYWRLKNQFGQYLDALQRTTIVEDPQGNAFALEHGPNGDVRIQVIKADEQFLTNGERYTEYPWNPGDDPMKDVKFATHISASHVGVP
jgi:hypothetical protein